MRSPPLARILVAALTAIAIGGGACSDPSGPHSASGGGGHGGHGAHGDGGGGGATRLVLSASALVVAGQVSPLAGVQGGPLPSNAGDADLTAAYQAAGVSLVRVGQGDGFAGCAGDEGRRLSLGDIFPDRTAPVDDASSYHFEDANLFFAGVVAAGATPLFQTSYDLGCESNSFTAGGEQAGAAPVDVDTWSAVVEHALAHFNDGWASGHAFGIRYVEFPNEPCTLGGFDCASHGYQPMLTAFAAFTKGIAAYNQAHGRSVVALGPGLPAADALGSIDMFVASVVDAGAMNGSVGYSYHDLDAPGPVRERARFLRSKLDAAGLTAMPLVASAWGWSESTAMPSGMGAAQQSARFAAHGAQTRTFLQGVWNEAVVFRANRRFESDAATPAPDSPFFYEQGDPTMAPGTPKPAYFGWMAFDDLVRTSPVRLEADYPAAGPALLAARDDGGHQLGLFASHFCATDTADCPPIPDYSITVYDLAPGVDLTYQRYVVDAQTTAFTPVSSGSLTVADDGSLTVTGAIDRWSIDYWKLALP